MPDDKKSFKEKRQERQQEKVSKLTEERKSEARKAGYDVDKPIDVGPPGPERKKRIDESIRQGVEGDIRTGLENIQSLRKAPDVKVPEMPNPEYSIQDVRKQRRARIGDILTGFSKGWQGDFSNPQQYQSRLKDENLAQYEQYKTASESAKKTLQDWENNYINEQLDYINKRIQDPTTSELEKIQLQKAQVQLENERVKKGITSERLRQLKEEGKAKPKEETETARLSQEAGEGTRITRDIPVSEAKEMEKKSQLDKEVKPIDLQLQSAQQELTQMDSENQGTSWWEWKDSKKRKELEQKIMDLTEERLSVYDKYYPKNTNISTKQPSGGIDPWEE